MSTRDEILCLFDVDGTLTTPMKVKEVIHERRIQIHLEESCNIYCN